MERTETLTDVPDNALADVVSDFESDGAMVVTTRQPDGNWTVVAYFSTMPPETK